MCVLHLFIYMLWGSRKNEVELVSLVLPGDLLLLVESWCDQQSEVIIFPGYSSFLVT